MTIRAVGPFNGVLPEPTGMAVGFVRDPARLPHVQYCQFVPAPEVLFRYWVFDPDEPTRVEDLDEAIWAYGDYRPTGKGEVLRGEWLAGRIKRWDFGFTLDDQTERSWSSQGLNPRNFLNMVRLSQAGVHRSARVLAALTGASWGSNSQSVQTLLGATSYWDQSSGNEFMADGSVNPNFQLIKKTLDRVARRIDLATNGAITERERYFVVSPKVAIAIAECGEIVNAVKQSVYAASILNPQQGWRNKKWNLPDEYAGFTWVVEDTVRTTIRRAADGTAATIGTDKDHILNAGTCYCVSRPGGLDGGYGMPSFSTLQLYHLGGEVQITAFSEPKHELVEGHVVMQDAPVVASTLSGFELTGCLSPGFTV
jgi:hypothetical protein